MKRTPFNPHPLAVSLITACTTPVIYAAVLGLIAIVIFATGASTIAQDKEAPMPTCAHGTQNEKQIRARLSNEIAQLRRICDLDSRQSRRLNVAAKGVTAKSMNTKKIFSGDPAHSKLWTQAMLKTLTQKQHTLFIDFNKKNENRRLAARKKLENSPDSSDAFAELTVEKLRGPLCLSEPQVKSVMDALKAALEGKTRNDWANECAKFRTTVLPEIVQPWPESQTLFLEELLTKPTEKLGVNWQPAWRAFDRDDCRKCHNGPIGA